MTAQQVVVVPDVMKKNFEKTDFFFRQTFVDRNVNVVSLQCQFERRNSALTKEKNFPS